MAQKLYEAMFVVDSNKAREDFANIEEICLSTITRFGGEIVKSIKWDDRKMTFEINKCKRGYLYPGSLQCREYFNRQDG